MSIDDRFPETLEAAQTGAEWALADLYRHLHPRLLRYLRSMEPAEGEDLAADVWLDVAAGLVRFGGDEQAFRAWAFTIANRRLIDLRRKRMRRATFAMDVDVLEARAGEGNVEQEAMTELTTAAALARIGALPRDQAEVVLLRVLADLPAAEVARILGKREGAVRALQHRGLRRLARQTLKEPVPK